MRILIIRHGHPNYEIDSLTERGFKEAEFLSEYLVKQNPTDIYCSELGRAQRTAEPTAKKTGLTPILCNWLIEYPLGANLTEEEKESGKKWLTPWEIAHPEWINDPSYCNFDTWMQTERFANAGYEERQKYVGEGFDAVMASKGLVREGRLYRATEEYEKHKDDVILFFCHFGLSLSIVSHLLPISLPLLWNGFSLDPTAITEFIPDKAGGDMRILRCMRLGDTTHLKDYTELPTPSAPREGWK